MASQNVDPTRANSSTRKQSGKSEVPAVGLHTATQRSVEICGIRLTVFIFAMCFHYLLVFIENIAVHSVNLFCYIFRLQQDLMTLMVRIADKLETLG